MSRIDEGSLDGLSVPPEERTPLVETLLEIIGRQARVIEELKAEIQRLKGLPGKPERKPGSLGEPARPGGGKRRRRGKRPGSQKRMKTQALHVDEVIPLEPEALPEGAQLHDYRTFTVQDLVIRPHVVRYRWARYKVPEREGLIAAELPASVRKHGHFGPGLRAYILNQHYQNHVTEPLILEDLRDRKFDISAGEVHAILNRGAASSFRTAYKA